jgi:hypothetical protein
MNRPRNLTIVLLLVAAGLTVWLLADVRESHQFRISAAPPVAPTPTAKEVHSAAETASATTVMVRPRYTGQDDQGHAWEVTADTADQRGTMQSSTLVLNTVAAVWRDVSRSEVFHLTADSGTYDAGGQVLGLSGNVSGTGPQMRINTPAAEANMATREVSGTEGVTVAGPLGGYDATLTAQNFVMEANAKTLTFTKNVHLVLRK